MKGMPDKPFQENKRKMYAGAHCSHAFAGQTTVGNQIGGFGSGLLHLLKQLVINSSPTPQSSIARVTRRARMRLCANLRSRNESGALGMGYFIKSTFLI